MSAGIFSRIATVFSRVGIPDGMQGTIAIIEQLFNLAASDIDNRAIVLAVNGTTVSTPASLVETTLFSYTLPKGTLKATSVALIRGFWQGNKPNTDTVTFKIYIGATLLQTITNSATGAWQVLQHLQISAGFVFSDGNISAAIDLTQDQVVKLTATNGTASAGDCVFKGGTLELLNPPT